MWELFPTHTIIFPILSFSEKCQVFNETFLEDYPANKL